MARCRPIWRDPTVCHKQPSADWLHPALSRKARPTPHEATDAIIGLTHFRPSSIRSSARRSATTYSVTRRAVEDVGRVVKIEERAADQDHALPSFPPGQKPDQLEALCSVHYHRHVSGAHQCYTAITANEAHHG